MRRTMIYSFCPPVCCFVLVKHLEGVAGFTGFKRLTSTRSVLRLCVARDELELLLRHRDIAAGARTPMLFFANKMDLPGALEPSEVSMQLGLPALTERPWQIAASNALTGEGVEEGIAWLVQALNRRGAAAAR